MTTKTTYDGRILSCKKVEDVLIVWVSGNPYSSFEVKRKANGDLHAYAFEGDFSIEEISKGKQMFLEYEEV